MGAYPSMLLLIKEAMSWLPISSKNCMALSISSLGAMVNLAILSPPVMGLEGKRLKGLEDSPGVALHTTTYLASWKQKSSIMVERYVRRVLEKEREIEENLKELEKKLERELRRMDVEHEKKMRELRLRLEAERKRMEREAMQEISRESQKIEEWYNREKKEIEKKARRNREKALAETRRILGGFGA